MALAPRQSLRSYSQGALTSLELRHRLGDATYGDVLRLPSAEHPPLPRAPLHGRI